MTKAPEHMVDLRRDLVAPDLVLRLSDFMTFHDDGATCVIAPHGELASVVVWNLEPGQENDYHLHPGSEHLSFVIEGVCEFTLGGAPPVDVRPGEMVVIPANVPHGIRNRTDGRASYVALTTRGAYEKVPIEHHAASPRNG